MLSSRTDAQRKESLAYLTTVMSTKPVDLPLSLPIGSLLDKMCPLVLDGSNGVRNQLLKSFQSFQPTELQDHVSKILPFIRAGMTHLSRDIRLSTTDFLSWLLEVAGEELVSCPGGWVKTLESFVTLLGWKLSKDTGKWTSTKTAFGSDTKMVVRVMQVLAHLLRVGFDVADNGVEALENSMVRAFPLWHTTEHSLPTKSSAYLYLDLFGTQQAEEIQILEDREDRIAVFNDRFRESISVGIEAAKQEGGELGRAAGLLTKSVKLAGTGQ